jgi:chemotaxis protein CheY-P-specific phosphatase CheC
MTMGHILNSRQQDFIYELISVGYGHAAKAFSAFSGHHITISNVKLEFSDDPKALSALVPGNSTFVTLTTDVIGDLKGKSYLIFSDKEVGRVVEACSPDKWKQSGADLTAHVLMELDNILSASVITELSNRLNLRIYGDVPHFHRQSGDDFFKMMLRDFSSNQRESGDILLITNAFFKFENDREMRPQFIWKFNSLFLKAISQSVAAESGITNE